MVHGWLVTDDRAKLIREIRELAAARCVEAGVHQFAARGLTLDPVSVVHTTHPTYGYSIRAERRRIVWAPEFYQFPRWAAACDLMFADGAGWDRPIHFVGRVGGHAATVSEEARDLMVRRLVFAHIGRPTIRAIDRGERPPFLDLSDVTVRDSSPAGGVDDPCRQDPRRTTRSIAASIS